MINQKPLRNFSFGVFLFLRLRYIEDRRQQEMLNPKINLRGNPDGHPAQQHSITAA